MDRVFHAHDWYLQTMSGNPDGFMSFVRCTVPGCSEDIRWKDEFTEAEWEELKDKYADKG